MSYTSLTAGAKMDMGRKQRGWPVPWEFRSEYCDSWGFDRFCTLYDLAELLDEWKSARAKNALRRG